MGEQVRGWRTPAVVILCACLILTLAMGARQTFGLFLRPMTGDLQLGREAFAFAIALQNLIWGFGQPVAGMFADKFGAARVIVLAAITYTTGLVVMHGASTPIGLDLAGALIGLGLSGTGSGLVVGVVARNVIPEKRSLAFGIVAAGGSFGQFIMVPYGQALITGLGWQQALLGLAATVAVVIPLSWAMVSSAHQTAVAVAGQSVREALKEAAEHKGFWLLTGGFFVCGFQVIFIGLHLPAYLMDQGMTPTVATTALALIGLFNIFGSFTAGWLGGRYSKKHLLSGIYFLRSVLITAFILLPTSPLTAYVFAAGMGFLWLGTMPLTNGMVAQIFGVRYLSMLYGGVFVGHQLGSFMGAWAGGHIYDATGSYDLVWLIAIALGVLAAALNLPINEGSLPRKELRGQPA